MALWIFIDAVIKDGNSIHISLLAFVVFGPRLVPLLHAHLNAFVKIRIGRHLSSAPGMAATNNIRSETPRIPIRRT